MDRVFFKEFEVELPRISQIEFNIVEFGAVGDGVTSNTKARYD